MNDPRALTHQMSRAARRHHPLTSGRVGSIWLLGSIWSVGIGLALMPHRAYFFCSDAISDS